MKPSWHLEAVRLAAKKPWVPWKDICAEVGARRRHKTPKKVLQSECVKKMEQMKLF